MIDKFFWCVWEYTFANGFIADILRAVFYLSYLKVALLVASQMCYCVLGLVRSKKIQNICPGGVVSKNKITCWPG